MTARIRKEIEALQPGRVYGMTLKNMSNAPYAFVNIRLNEKGYQLRAAWLVPETHDEDPGSVSCGCMLEGRSHVEASKVYSREEVADLINDFISAKDDVRNKRMTKFEKAERIG
jgi:hypothetical protein